MRISAFFSASILFAAASAEAAHAQFKVSLTPSGSFRSQSDAVEGTATVKDGVYSVAAPVTMKVATFNSGIQLRDEHVKKKYLETEKFPIATVKDVRGEKGSFTATLELHGVSHAVQGSYKIDDDQLTADFPAKISDYGITKPLYMGVGCKDEVAVEITLPVTPQK